MIKRFKRNGGADPLDPNNSGGAGGDKKDVVSFETHQKLLDQRKADQKKLGDISTQLKTLQSQLKDREAKDAQDKDAKDKEQGNYKSLVESREARIKELETTNTELIEKVTGLEGKYMNANKLNAFHGAINGKLKSDKYVSLVDLEKIAINPENGTIDESSLKAYATDFVNSHKELIDFKGGGHKLPGGSASHSGSLTHDEWKEIAKKDPAEARKRMKDVRK